LLFSQLEYATVQGGVRAVDCATEVLVVASANYMTLYGFTGDNEMRPMQKVQGSDSKIDSVALHQTAVSNTPIRTQLCLMFADHWAAGRNLGVQEETSGMYCKGLYISQPGGILCYFSLDATTLSSIQLRAAPQLVRPHGCPVLAMFQMQPRAFC
jgi:hypothetical protein